MALRVGDMAPEFELAGVTGDKIHRVRLGEYKGKKHVVVAFHPINWTPV